MQDRHTNRKKNFEEQAFTTLKYVIPFIENRKLIGKGLKILEIGCGEAGNIKPFLDRECICVGIDISESKIEFGRQVFSRHTLNKNITLITDDFYNWSTTELFDIIILRDVLEHLQNHYKFFTSVKQLLKPDGICFLGFAPWQSPFGGHQQICKNKILSHLPFIHLLPNNLYFGLIKKTNEKKIEELIEIKNTRISIGRFLELVNKTELIITKQNYYFINPNYEIKFGLKPMKQIFYFVPWLRNFIITSGYFLIEKGNLEN